MDRKHAIDLRRAVTKALLALLVAGALAPAACGGTSALSATSLPPGSGKIAFIRGADLCTIQPDGTELKRIAGHALCAAWSPDGTHLAYGGMKAVYVVEADGSGRRQVASGHRFFEAGIAWSPNGSQVVFSNGSNLVVVSADGTARRPLTRFTLSIADTSPAWSPQGRIFFARTHRHADKSEIVSVNADGSGLETVTSTARLAAFSLSHDGRWLLLWDSSSRGCVRIATSGHGGQHVVLKKAPGPRPPRLTGPGALLESSWSPDGGRIVFAAFTGVVWSMGTSRSLYLMRADGSHLRQLPNTRGASWPAWQPR